MVLLTVLPFYDVLVHLYFCEVVLIDGIRFRMDSDELSDIQSRLYKMIPKQTQDIVSFWRFHSIRRP
ncbi:hypothetical protein Y032_0122g1077 [Ancylostoma ceylanicum]|nr:hypothetical protein Y032_0122g1077 [Ancylostoma ceylanicum]